MLEGQVQTTDVPQSKRAEYKVIIEQDGGRYYWRTRNSLEVRRSESGMYVTYTALNGSGYVRIYGALMRKMHSQLPKAEQLKNYLYMEHLVNQMGSITYFGW